jgi:hypothetical protein
VTRHGPENDVGEIRALVDGTPCRPGDRVRIVALDVHAGEWSAESLALFNAAALRPQRVRDVDGNGDAVWVAIDVEDDGSPGSEGSRHTLCVLPEELARATQ